MKYFSSYSARKNTYFIGFLLFFSFINSFSAWGQINPAQNLNTETEECTPCEEARKNNKAVSQLAPTNLSQKDKEKYQIDYSRIDENLSEEERNKEIHRLKNEMLLRQENDAKLQRDK